MQGIKYRFRENFFYLLIFLFCIFVFVTRLYSNGFVMGYRTTFVLTGSMEPHIPVASLLLERKYEKEEPLQVGEVITFLNEYDGKTMRITHRIVQMDGNFIFTKGDANSKPDDFVVDKSKIEGKVVVVIPYFLPIFFGFVAALWNLKVFLGREQKKDV